MRNGANVLRSLMFTGAVLMAALLVANPAQAQVDRIVVLDADGTEIPLEGQIIQGDVFIFLRTLTPDNVVENVQYVIRDAAFNTVLSDIARKFPYALQGGKFATSKLVDGPYLLRYLYTASDSSGSYAGSSVRNVERLVRRPRGRGHPGMDAIQRGDSQTFSEQTIEGTRTQ